MKQVQREEILDYVTYGEERDQIRAEALAAKEARRVIVADELTFLFENATTVRYQVLEMVRAEHLVKESEIQHELETYNELIGGPGELGCTLLIGIDDPKRRDVVLREWLELPEHIAVELEDGTKVPATYDPRQVGEDRLSSVQFLKFAVGGRVPVAVVVDHPALSGRTVLSEAQKESLAADLSGV